MELVTLLGDFVSGINFRGLPERTVEHTKMHILDTLGAMVAGRRTGEAAALRRLITSIDAPGGGGSLLSAVCARVATTRCTEIDDIHLASCTTPGSVIVPTALCLAESGCFGNGKDLIASVVAGYELLIRMGLSVDGARVLYKGIWPTYAAGAFGSAAVTARALGLDREKCSHAFSSALTLSGGTAGRIRSNLSSRWLTLGAAAQNGVLAAFGAQEGFSGDLALLDRDEFPLRGLVTRKEKLTEGIGETFLISGTALKPYPTARQALASVEAFREIMASGKIAPDSIDDIAVQVPMSYAAMIDSRELPTTRLESLVSVRYQIALAAFHPESLVDAGRETLPADVNMMHLVTKIRVVPSADLERLYPDVWPASVSVTAGGHRFSRDVVRFRWDSCESLGWEEIDAKFRRVAAPAYAQKLLDEIVATTRRLESIEHPRRLADLLLADLPERSPRKFRSEEGGRQDGF
jgi:2-methylcitrate dehydratase PrpD